MACNDYFSKTFTNLEKHYNKLGKEIENTRMLMKGWDSEYAYAYSLRIHEEAEKITLNARNLPCYLGMRDAEERVRSEMEKIVSVEIGYTQEGWFGIKMFALLHREEHGNVNYIKQRLYCVTSFVIRVSVCFYFFIYNMLWKINAGALI